MILLLVCCTLKQGRIQDGNVHCNVLYLCQGANTVAMFRGTQNKPISLSDNARGKVHRLI